MVLLISGYDAKKGQGEVKYGQTSKIEPFLLNIAYLDQFCRMIPKVIFWTYCNYIRQKILALQKMILSVSPVFFHRETYRNISQIRDKHFV